MKKKTESTSPPALSIVTISGSDDSVNAITATPDAEHDGHVQWSPIDADGLRDAFTEVAGFADWTEQTYALIDQFIAAATQQPGAVFGFRAGEADLPVLLSFRPGEGLSLGRAEYPDWFSTAGPDGDGDEDDLPLSSPGAVESTVSGLLRPLQSPAPVKEASGWRVCVPRRHKARGMAEAISTTAATYLASLSQRNLSIREGKETYCALFRYEADAKEFSRILGTTEPVIEDQAEQIALRLLRED